MTATLDIIAPPGTLGISVSHYPQGDGPFVVRVLPDSPLLGKIKVGDIILSIDDVDVRQSSDVVNIMKRALDNEKKITILKVPPSPTKPPPPRRSVGSAKSPGPQISCHNVQDDEVVEVNIKMNELNDYAQSLDESATKILRVKKEKGDSNTIKGTGPAGAATASLLGEDDVEIVEKITDESSFYYGLYVDARSGKAVNKPRSDNELTPTPTRAVVSSGKQVVSPSCSASRRCDDASGCDVDVEDIPKIRRTEEEKDNGVITSRNVNSFNRSVDTDGFAAARAHRLQSKLNMALDESRQQAAELDRLRTELEHREKKQQAAELDRLQMKLEDQDKKLELQKQQIIDELLQKQAHESRQKAAELDRLQMKLEDRDKKLELQKQQIDKLLKKQAIQENVDDDDDDDGEDGDDSVVEITNHQEINRSNERRDKEKRQLLRNIDLNSCVEIRPSQIHGVGIFANRAIPKGTQVFKFNCKPTHKTVDCSQDEIDSLLPDAQRMVKKFFLPRRGCYPIPKHGIACALGLSFLVNSCEVEDVFDFNANLEFGDKKDFSGYLEIVAARKIDPDEELVLSYTFDRSRTVPVPDHVVSSSLMTPSNSHHRRSRSGQPPLRQSTRDSSPPSRLRKRHGRIDYSPSKERKRKKDRKSNCGRFSNRDAMFWMEPPDCQVGVWVRGRVHGYVTAQERNRNRECTCKQAICNCPKYTRGKYQYTAEGYISENDSEYFSDEDDTVKIGGLSGKALWK
ncbi:hypothetical protein ACHAWC_003324 [Mediolabrus comicus]